MTIVAYRDVKTGAAACCSCAGKVNEQLGPPGEGEVESITRAEADGEPLFCSICLEEV